MLVTTVHDPTMKDIELAQIWAKRLNAALVERNGLSIRKLQAMDEKGEVLVVSQSETKCYSHAQSPVFFHPGMAMIRIKRLMNGDNDLLLEAAEAAEGDVILDCTAGLASDSIVLSYAAGPLGKVTAVESSVLLYWMAKDGLNQYISDLHELNEAMRRISLVHADHLDVLRTLPDRSIDIIYFDPMFRIPVVQSPSMRPLRYWANSAPIRKEAIVEAKRAARKTIVLKEHRDSPEFSRLGFDHVHRTRSNIAYGVIHL